MESGKPGNVTANNVLPVALLSILTHFTAVNEKYESHWFATEMQLGTFYVCVDLE